MPHVKVPKLKVTVMSDGRLVPYRREGKLSPTDDGWWESVLADASRRDLRGETRIGADSAYAYLRLDRQHGTEIMVSCACGLNGVFNKAELVSAMGGDCNVTWLATKLISDCKRINKIGNYCHAVCLR